MIRLMSWITIGVLIAVLAVVLWGIWVAAKEITELEHLFVYGMWGIMTLILGTAAYMAFALPTVATDSASSTSQKNTLRAQESNLLQ